MFVKICGITTEKDALLAIALGADALGFVFAPGSPRMVTVDEATDIVKHVPYDEVLTVGVFRDERPERVAEILNKVGLKAAQLPGREPPGEGAWVRQGVRRACRRRAGRRPESRLGPCVRLGAGRRRAGRRSSPPRRWAHARQRRRG